MFPMLRRQHVAYTVMYSTHVAKLCQLHVHKPKLRFVMCTLSGTTQCNAHLAHLAQDLIPCIQELHLLDAAIFF